MTSTSRLSDFHLFTDEDLNRVDMELSDALFDLDPSELIPFGEKEEESDVMVTLEATMAEEQTDLMFLPFDRLLDAEPKTPLHPNKNPFLKKCLTFLQRIKKNEKSSQAGLEYQAGLFSIM